MGRGGSRAGAGSVGDIHDVFVYLVWFNWFPGERGFGPDYGFSSLVVIKTSKQTP